MDGMAWLLDEVAVMDERHEDDEDEAWNEYVYWEVAWNDGH